MPEQIFREYRFWRCWSKVRCGDFLMASFTLQTNLYKNAQNEMQLCSSKGPTITPQTVPGHYNSL